MNDRQPSPGEIVIFAAGAVALIASFFDFWEDTSAWGKSAFPVVTLVPVYCVLVAAYAAATRYGKLRLRASIAGFTPDQIQTALGLFAGIMGFFWMSAGDLELGGYLVVFAGIAAAIGVVMRQREGLFR